MIAYLGGTTIADNNPYRLLNMVVRAVRTKRFVKAIVVATRRSKVISDNVRHSNSFFSFYVSFRSKTLGIGGLISIIISFSLIIFASGSPTFYLLLAALYIFSLIDLWVLYKAISGDRL